VFFRRNHHTLMHGLGHKVHDALSDEEVADAPTTPAPTPRQLVAAAPLDAQKLVDRLSSLRECERPRRLSVGLPPASPASPGLPHSVSSPALSALVRQRAPCAFLKAPPAVRPPNPTQFAAASGDHRWALVQDRGGEIRVWEQEAPERYRVLVPEQKDGPVRRCAFASAQPRIATLSADGTVRLYCLVTGKLLHRFLCAGEVQALSFRDDDTVLVAHLAAEDEMAWPAAA
jgi:hypothetical protein